MSDESGESAVRRDRFSGGPARGFLSSLAGDARIFAADLAVDRAHVVMLAEQGIVDDDVAGEILAALDEVEAAGHGALTEGEDVHEAIETAVIERMGPEGGRMHTARSRNDEVATCLRWRLREDLLDAAETTLRLRDVLVDAATDHTETVMPGYTHLQPAQPTTVAHYLLSYESNVARDTGRLLDSYARVNESPLGAAAFAGTPFDVDRERTAELLGFDGLVENAMDAASSRDFLLEATSALATHAVTLSGIAEDFVLYANRGYVDLADDYSSTSSIMPQKKNPDTLELVRSVAGEAAGDLSALLTTLKGLPRAYNRDLQNAHPHAFDAVESVVAATEVTAGAVATATWDETTLEAAAGEGFSTATGVADLLAMAGLPFRTAHEIVARAAAAAEERAAAAAEERAAAAADGTTATSGGDTPDLATLDSVTEETLGESLFDHVSREAVERALDPAQSVASRDSVGGPAPDAVASALASAEETLDADAATVDARRAALADAEDALETEVARYV
ncbi:argininosuccinate lyase [Salinigranum salinum]|uniref:argininosuccinate lyase n=1 Tax=Salinigranum salinum TaxID=1364937 RepID=UPI0012603FEC|nr:argininosuccinate lyase [Salinigranum salinum]